MKRKRWTPEEDNYLRDNFCDMAYEDIATNLNRTVAAVACRVDAIKLERPSVFNDIIDQYIIKNHGTLPNKQIAATLNITVSSLEHRITHLKLAVDNKYSEYEDEFIKANYSSMSYAQIAKILGRTKRGVECRAPMLGLQKHKRKKYTNEEIQRVITADSIEKRLGLAKEFDVSYDSISGIRRRKTGINCKLAHKFKSMINRCYNKNNHDYHRYGERGVKISDEWLADDRLFFQWAIDNGYKEELTIERIDNNGPYSPPNCKWATLKEQANNTSQNVFLTAFNERKTMKQWSEDHRCVIPYTALRTRIKNGFLDRFTPEEILTFNRSQVKKANK